MSLVARWSLHDLAEGGIVAAGRLVEDAEQSGEGYADLVATQASLLDRLASTIASSFRMAASR